MICVLCEHESSVFALAAWLGLPGVARDVNLCAAHQASVTQATRDIVAAAERKVAPPTTRKIQVSYCGHGRRYEFATNEAGRVIYRRGVAGCCGDFGED